MATPNWLRYANQSAVRNMPLSQQLADALQFLPELGVTMEVFSGGQPGKGLAALNRRVGSTRHDHGNAADAFFYKDGRRLDWANPDDLPIFDQIVARARQNGVTGFGAGPGYMRPGSMHIGFGNEAVWGAGGKGANAPEWLRRAASGAPVAGSVLDKDQQDFVKNNPQPGGYGPGIDDPNAPNKPAQPAFSSPAMASAGIPVEVARYAASDDDEPNAMQRLGAAISAMETRAPMGGGFGGSAGPGNQLLQYLNSPKFSDMLMKKRLG